MQEIEIIETTSHPPKIKINQPSKFQFSDEEDGLWTLEFDGALGKEEARIGMWIHGPMN